MMTRNRPRVCSSARLNRAVVAMAGALLCSASLVAQTPEELKLYADARRVEGEFVFTHEFGQPGKEGSLRVQFDRRGGLVWNVTLLDHWVHPKDDGEDSLGANDYYPLAYHVEPGVPALLFEQDPADVLAGAPFADRPFVYSSATVFDHAISADGTEVRFTLDGGKGLTLTKVFRHRPERRELELAIGLTASGDSDPTAVGQSFRFSMTGLTLANPTTSSLFGNLAFAIGAWKLADGSTGEFIQKPPGPPEALMAEGAGASIAFAGTTNRFFASLLYPYNDTAREGLLAVTTDSVPGVAQLVPPTPARTVPTPIYRLRMPTPAAGQTTEMTFGLYLGPKSFRAFEDIEDHARFLPVLDADLKPVCCPIPGVTMLSKLLLKLLGFFYGILGNWGFAIVCLTLVVRMLLLPINFRMQKAMRAYGSKMAVLKPKMDDIKKQYVNDPKALQQAMFAFQRENKMMPPIGGCLPMLLTIPIWIGLFTALRTSYDLRHQPFVLWIDDLSEPDRLIELGLPFVPYFNLLPLIMVGLWLYLQTRTPLPSDPQQRQVQKIMRFMPIMMGIMLYGYASGLMVYMVTSSLWAIVEMRITKKILGPISPEAAAAAPMPVI